MTFYPDNRQSVGFALEDLAMASLAYSRAAAPGVGTRVTF
jgi:ornithine cyclodeaminase/alanine dehydrogenase-like protein (mu-crystallin family)